LVDWWLSTRICLLSVVIVTLPLPSIQSQNPGHVVIIPSTMTDETRALGPCRAYTFLFILINWFIYLLVSVEQLNTNRRITFSKA